MTSSAPATDCVVWWASPTCDPDLLAVLDDHERARVDRLKRTADRERYVAAHALTRLLLADVTGTAPEALRFDRTCGSCGGPHGKPRLVGEMSSHFSLTHSGAWVGVAVTTEGEVGLDVESIDAVPEDWLTALASEVLADTELREYEALPPASRSEGLAVWWTRKEAVLKATGEGLATSLSSLTVTPPSSSPAVLTWQPAGAAPRPAVWLQDLSPGGPNVAAVAVIGRQNVTVVERNGDRVLSRARARAGATRSLWP